ncbi:site-specific DNA-methyltransferase [Ethanoligenens harbinense]|uniref:Site-specific DNA-methyltransferase (Adenine-specific) n=1 Tax=Ethanoligenens harbinense (strain DSM 18485 / JCM 12961 / CGMCC 1.5033 / YUAN-3) TaxID=663278 RepID=E6U2P9_ETHHY|nr:site-specific DNA-methyltransferase [Ethanoligenens harbinense]ADU27441.1 Site-specific DNA-methyltransferase (adenine-specific) [Ethanoligenens harbinense YUAN-3]AVQ96499.1 site-specific DNA-methyltransferase [Ethanoligenens harbinense YUAN-3]AYF39161.1 site-specific DNA-methyltransferase [Ethanoligenens harbinense]AYF41984.1 site-specific DNA-methyltransferase [Ethanoligenens harbinense]QCN92740.1 site-specific DNA-methyltransferase [Ethanoligenens harbinense]
MPEILDGMSMNLEKSNMDKLKAAFPECFAEGKLDIDKLLSLCGEYIDNDFEKYKFEWKGKAECLKLAQKRSTGTLRPCPEESVNWDTTQNLYIEGDNLEVLKLLQTSYYRKVKMIYIDPPYNTGNDFVYADDFADPMARYKEVTQQTTKSNPETMGRFHTNWLNMMYPRLRLAANLLRDDGVIFISIDDGEQTNLRKLCDEVFGEENFIAQIIWQKVYSPRMDVQGFSVSHDYILCYVKQSFDSIHKETFAQNSAQFNFVDQQSGQKYRRRSVRKEGSHSTRSERPNLWFPLMAPDGTEVYPVKPDGTEGCWRWSKGTYIENQSKGIVEWVQTENGWQVYAKQYLKEEATKPPETLWFHQEVGHNHAAMEELKKLLGAKVFDSPKPKNLIEKMLRIATTGDEDIILDFFSGSATTAHAVMQLNAEDGGNRRFILVQLPEVCDENSEAYKAGYKNICEVGKERIRRAGRKLTETDGQMQLGEDDKEPLDIGFRVYKLDSSNLKTWDDTPIEDNQLNILYKRMNGMIHRVKYDRSEMDMVCEIMLKLGAPLTCPVSKIEINSKSAYTVGEDCTLLICLAENIQPSDVEAIAEYAAAIVVIARDSFADDTAMANAYYILRDKGIELKLV